jgi:hypothetical protein
MAYISFLIRDSGGRIYGLRSLRYLGNSVTLSYNLRLLRLLSPRTVRPVGREGLSGVWHSLVEIVKKVVINKKG